MRGDFDEDELEDDDDIDAGEVEDDEDLDSDEDELDEADVDEEARAFYEEHAR